uniref:Uncharacterized protein n=1 Tax=Romanomermis culicivorax TaxID=13658 RepID=A0A915HPH3_ROMCU
MSTDSKFLGSTNLLTDSTKSKTKTMLTSQTPGTSSSMSQAQSTAVTTKVPSKSTMSQANIGRGKKTQEYKTRLEETTMCQHKVKCHQGLHKELQNPGPLCTSPTPPLVEGKQNQEAQSE